MVGEDLAAVSAEQWSSAMKIYASTWADADLVDRPGLSVFWADSPFFLWNGLLLNERSPTRSQLHSAVAEAAEYMRRKERPGLMYACEEFGSSGDLAVSAAEFMLAPKARLTGMIADLRFAARASLPGFRVVRVNSKETATHFAGVIAESLNLSHDICNAEFVDKAFWREEAYAYVSYYQDEPASISSIIVDKDVLYVGLVATRTCFQKRGFSYATNVHMLRHVRDATGISRAALHATCQGLPVYTKLGFRPITAITGFGFG